jgi:hypothetical protein
LATTLGFAPVSRAVGLAIFSRLAHRWRIPKGDWHVVLGRDSPNTIRNWERSARASDVGPPLDADVQERLSHLVAIYDALHRLFGDPTFADRWVHVGNRAFGGDPPLARLLTGRFSDIYEVRLYLEQCLNR